MTIKHRIVTANAPVGGDIINGAMVGGLAGIASQLSGMIAQVSALASAGTSLPALNMIGGQIATLAGTLTGSTASIGSSMVTAATSMATAAQSAMPALASTLSSLSSSLNSMVDPSGLLASVIHEHKLDKVIGVMTSAFQNQHSTAWTPQGLIHSSTQLVNSIAPMLPHMGNGSFSDVLTVTKQITAGLPITAPSFGISSDARLKSNIQDFPATLELAMTLKVKTFDKKNIHIDHMQVASISDEPPVATFGLIAQEAEKIFPNIVAHDPVTDFLTVHETKVAFIALAALQEFVVEMRAEIADLKKQLSEKNG